MLILKMLFTAPGAPLPKAINAAVTPLGLFPETHSQFSAVRTAYCIIIKYNYHDSATSTTYVTPALWEYWSVMISQYYDAS